MLVYLVNFAALVVIGLQALSTICHCGTDYGREFFWDHYLSSNGFVAVPDYLFTMVSWNDNWCASYRRFSYCIVMCTYTAAQGEQISLSTSFLFLCASSPPLSSFSSFSFSSFSSPIPLLLTSSSSSSPSFLPPFFYSLLPLPFLFSFLLLFVSTETLYHMHYMMMYHTTL